MRIGEEDQSQAPTLLPTTAGHWSIAPNVITALMDVSEDSMSSRRVALSHSSKLCRSIPARLF